MHSHNLPLLWKLSCQYLCCTWPGYSQQGPCLWLSWNIEWLATVTERLTPEPQVDLSAYQSDKCKSEDLTGWEWAKWDKENTLYQDIIFNTEGINRKRDHTFQEKKANESFSQVCFYLSNWKSFYSKQHIFFFDCTPILPLLCKLEPNQHYNMYVF